MAHWLLALHNAACSRLTPPHPASPPSPPAPQLDMRAEVAVLSRNVVIQGDKDSEVTMYGAQMLTSTPPSLAKARVQLQNVELTRTGQAFRLGRYSVHFHMHGDTGFNSWLKNCSLHHTFSRALAVHGTHRLLVQHNVAYHVMGHGFFIEDGNEVRAAACGAVEAVLCDLVMRIMFSRHS
jgi:hypothetical protein